MMAEMMNLNKSGKIPSLLLSLGIIGFALVFLGAAIIRFARDEIFSVLGGFVIAGGVTLLSVTRLMQK